MAPSTSSLFHPKKKPINSVAAPVKRADSQDTVSTNGSGSQSPNRKVRPAPRPRPKPDEDVRPPPPEGPFSEYRLMSSALNGWKYDVMKFDSRKPVDITTWHQPVKLNRKDPRREDDTGAVPMPQAVAPMLGPDGKPVIGMDGKMVMVDAEGRPIRPGESYGPGGSQGSGGEKGKDKDKVSAAKKKFQKKTKQVFLVPDAVRQLRREERYPWVIEDMTQKEVWVGKMEEVAKSETQAMFMPAANDIFKFVPAHRWYKFHKKPNYHIPNLEEAEEMMTQRQKNKDPERWLLRNRNGQAPSEATVAMFKSETGAVPSGSLVHSAGQSLGPGGRRLKAVDSGMDGLFGDEDEDEDGEGGRRKRTREMGAEGELDELDYEEDFADDEEKVEGEMDDEEAKELEERLKREYKTANKLREGFIDESEEEEDEMKLSGAGKDMRKLMKKLEKNTAYDESDEEKNPYASSEEEEEEEEAPPAPTGPAIQPPEPRPGSRSTSQAPSGAKTPSASQGQVTAGAAKAEPASRATSPVPGHSGHSVVAKRATSPKMPKLKTAGIGATSPSRATSPLAGGSRPTSPGGTAAAPAGNHAPAQAPGAGPSNKRKATEEPGSPTNGTGSGAPSKPKKRKAQTGPVNGELDVYMLVDWLRETPDASTRDCIHHFTPYLNTDEKKKGFTQLVKEVAQLKNGVLVLRNAYRKPDASTPSAPSPPAGAE